jgi:hypothetical protein
LLLSHSRVIDIVASMRMGTVGDSTIDTTVLQPTLDLNSSLDLSLNTTLDLDTMIDRSTTTEDHTSMTTAPSPIPLVHHSHPTTIVVHHCRRLKILERDHSLATRIRIEGDGRGIAAEAGGEGSARWSLRCLGWMRCMFGIRVHVFSSRPVGQFLFHSNRASPMQQLQDD